VRGARDACGLGRPCATPHRAEARGPGYDSPLELAELEPAELPEHADVLALDRLDELSPRQREIVELRYFAGVEFAEIAGLLECSERTAKREWERARAFLHAQLG